jgi:hypothetical protein
LCLQKSIGMKLIKNIPVEYKIIYVIMILMVARLGMIINLILKTW